MKTNLQFFLNQLTNKKHLYMLFAFLITIQGFASPRQKAEAKISFALKNVTITELFDVIEQKTAYTFVFDEKVSGNTKRISIEAEKESIESILKKITAKTGIEFKRLNN